MAALLIVTMLVTVFKVPDTAKPTETQFVSPWRDFVHAFAVDLRRHRDFGWLMASRLLIMMGILGLQSFAFFYFGDVFFANDRKQTTLATAVLLGLVVLVGLAVTWPAAKLSDRLGRKRIVFGGGMIGAAATVAIIFSHYPLLPPGLVQALAGALHVPGLAAQAVLFGFAIGVGFGAFLSVDWAFITDVIPPGEAGRFMGFSNIATAGACIIAPLSAGWLLDYFNAGPPLPRLPGGYPGVFGLFAAWMIAGSLLVLKVREPAR